MSETAVTGKRAVPTATQALVLPSSIVLILALMAGGLSLDRLSESFSGLGAPGEVRFVGLVVVALLLCLSVLVRLPKSPVSSSTNGWILAIVVVHCWVMLSWIWSDRSDFASQQLYELTLLLGTFVVSSTIFRRQPRRLVLLLFAVFGLLALGFCALSLVLLGGMSGALSVVGAGGIGSARLLGVGVLVSLFWFLRTQRVRFLLPVPLFLAGMMLSGSRASILALAVSGLALWLSRKWIVGPEQRLSALPVIIAVATGVVTLAVILATQIGRQMVTNFLLSNFVADSASASGAGLYLADRNVIFGAALTEFRDHLVAGSGLGTYLGPFGELYPHNLALNFAVDGGVLGLIGFLVVLYWPMQRIVRSRDSLALGALVTGLFFLVASLFAGTYYDARFLWVFLMLGMLCVDQPGVKLRDNKMLPE